MKHVGVVAVMLSLAACGSSPQTRFYTLDPIPPDTQVQYTLRAPIKVNAVQVPSLLDRRNMVRGQNGNRLDVSGQNRWGAVFGQMAERVLTQDLESRLPSGMVIPPGSPASRHTRGLVVDILFFAPDGSGQLVLDAYWTLLRGSPPNPVLRRHAHLTRPSSASAAKQAAAMSEVLAQLADDIAAAISENDGPGGGKR